MGRIDKRSSDVVASGASAPSGLAHPVWWLALGLLLLNDHVLKASSAAGWVTGKLSDFAGLIVAPVLAAAIFPRRRRAARIGAFACVVIAFCAIKLSATAAHWVEAALSWRIWCDWTDLVALAVVPLAHRISNGTLPCPAVPPRWRPALLRAGAFVGAIACMATSSEDHFYRTKAYLANLTHEDVGVLMWHPTEPLDCSVSRTQAADFDPSAFRLARCRWVAAMRRVAIDLGATVVLGETPEHPIEPDPGPPRACDAVLVRVAGAQDTLVYWQGIEAVAVGLGDGSSTYEGELAARGVFLETFDGKRIVNTGSSLRSWTVTWTMPTPSPDCEASP